MLAHGGGTIAYIGATSSVKGYAKSSAFATGKFALRALAQCNAREFGPKGIHVFHVIIDGSIDNVPLGEDREVKAGRLDSRARLEQDSARDRDSVAERGGFEPPVSREELPTENGAAVGDLSRGTSSAYCGE